eukprot:TRINITY_DN1388_c0_g1_i3.p1 TRINITY_DN1388_c0_g1~~TRINITY_DN1388_c0_g1_i3.p1  ORF type:complete len:246 (+),score=83.71 TRINITY_DN1388_c0_g1_i3:65-739(+)
MTGRRAQGELQGITLLALLSLTVALVTANTLTATPKPTSSPSHPPSRIPTNSPTRMPSQSQTPSHSSSSHYSPSRTPGPEPSPSSSPEPLPSASSSPRPTPANDVFLKTCNVTNFHAAVSPYSHLVFCCPLTYNVNGDSGNVTSSFYQILSQSMLSYQAIMGISAYCQTPSTPVGQYDDNYIYSIDTPFANPGYVTYFALFGFYNPNHQPLKLEVLNFSVTSHL